MSKEEAEQYLRGLGYDRFYFGELPLIYCGTSGKPGGRIFRLESEHLYERVAYERLTDYWEECNVVEAKLKG